MSILDLAHSAGPAADTHTHDRNSDAGRELKIRWLWQFRLAIIVGQVLMLLAAWIIKSHEVRFFPVLLILMIELMENAALIRVGRRSRPINVTAIGVVIMADIILLSAVLYFSGGTMNPLTIFYLVEVVATAVLLGDAWTWFAAGESIFCYGLLFFLPGNVMPPMGPDMGDVSLRLHLIGMLISFIIAALCVASFITLLQNDQRKLSRQLAHARDRTRRMERFTALTAVAAGAAHELATPLATIAVAAGEMSREIQRRETVSELQHDIELIESQVQRCREILEQLSPAGAVGNPRETVSIGELVQAVLAGFSEGDARRVRVRMHDGGTYPLPARRLIQGLTALVQNAFDASPPNAEVELCIERKDQLLIFTIINSGPEMSADALEHYGEPFFTTKPEGRGLGVFLVHELAIEYGGVLKAENILQGGVCVRLELPICFAGALSHDV
ncbi:MAG: ATP-binding protein [Phycisphaerae bacterium]